MNELAARLGSLSNTTHGFIYFADEAGQEYSAAGLGPHQHYFASRAAPMGPVGPELVVATFFNFCPDRVHAAVPSCWEAASPAAIQSARMRAAGRVLERACPDFEHAAIAEATGLVQSMVDGVGDEGKPLAAANRAVGLVDEPWIDLWQLITVIREWRGDAHVASLCAHGLTAVEALILHAATGTVSRGALQSTRGWPSETWEAGIASLAQRGLVTDDGAFTDQGRQFREAIETQTDQASQSLVDAIGDDATSRLCELLKPISKGLMASGVFAPLLAARGDQN